MKKESKLAMRINARLKESDYAEVLKRAGKYTRGNLSAYLVLAATSYEPKKRP